VEKEAPIHISNVALYDPKSKGGTRIRHRIRFEKDGDRQVVIKDRIAARSGEVIERPE
jgi:ribosomal protein L24